MAEGRKLRQRLDIIWDKALPIGSALPGGPPPDRYIPKAIGMGPGWGVYDRKLGRHLTDREVSRIPLEHLRDEKLVN